jgi:putative ABC transport system permease protein
MKYHFIVFAFRYGLRSLKRNPRRTMITISTVSLSVAISIISTQFSVAMMSLWRDGAADTGAGHYQVHAPGYWKKPEGVSLPLTMKNDGPIEDFLKAENSTTYFSRRLKIEGIISAGYKTIYFIGIGVDPKTELLVSPKLFNIESDVGAFVNDENRFQITVGKGLAEALDLEIGSEVSLLAPTVNGPPNAIDVVIGGIVDVPLPSFSKRVVYLHIEQAQRLVRAPGRYNEIAGRIGDIENLNNVLPFLKDSVAKAGGEMRPWWEVDPIIRDVENIFYSAINIVSMLLFSLAGLSVLNLIYMMVAERTVEIGTLMAIGARSHKILALFCAEAMVIGAVGGALGVLLGTVAIELMNTTGIPFKNPFGGGLIDVFPENNLSFTLIVFSLSIFTCLVASIIPAKRASAIEPLEAFRGQFL